jgi:cobalt-zinc-cadmium resistance protein CzcA
MRRLTHLLLQYRPLVVILLLAWLATGIVMFLHLDIEAYPDPSPPLVEVIAQNPAWSAEEMEQLVTVPIETELFGIPRLEGVRSVSIFGLSDVKMYFDYGSDYYWDRQEVLNRLQLVSLPSNVSPQLSPESPIGEIYRYQVTGPDYSLNELKAEQDWFIHREVKQVPGIIDVTTFGGTTRQYQAEIDPGKLLQFGVTLPQVIAAVGNSNANVGGNYMTMGSQSVNVRGIGLLHTVQDMQNVLVAEHNGVPVYLGQLGDVHEGYQPRLGRVGIDQNNDAIEAIVLLERGQKSLPALKALREKFARLNNGLLPHGIKIKTIYDRTDLINLTTHTVREVVVLGLVLVTALLFLFLGDWRISLIAALAIPLSLLFAFTVMVLAGQSANLISVGAIDFGILVDAAVIDLEHIHRALRLRKPSQPVYDVIANAMAEASRPVLFSVGVILAAFIPLFTMTGVPGKIFAPMSYTYGYALIGGRLFALLFAPVLASFGAESARERGEGHTRLVHWLHDKYERILPRLLNRRAVVLGAGLALLVGAAILVPFLGGEFMPKLDEGNLWVRATLPQDISSESSTKLADDLRAFFLAYPEVTHVVSQMGRPDDGTDVATFNNIEFYVQLKPEGQWPGHISKVKLIQEMNERLQKYPGIDFNFSQNIEDNVEEAMSGVKGENSLKLFGDDIDVLAEKAGEIRDVMAQVPGIADLAVFQETGQPELLVSIDRAASARYGIAAADVNTAVQAAVGGFAATQILEGDRRFDFVVRYQPPFRQTPDAIRNILLPTPDGGRISLGQVANITLRNGAFTIYRENGRRYIPVKFSVRGRDLVSTFRDVQTRLGQIVHLPEGYHYEWAGEYESLRMEQHRLAVIVPISLVIILGLLYALFNSVRAALIVVAVLPFGAIGGVLTLFLSRTPFSISASVGFASALGVATLGSSVFLSGIRRAYHGEVPKNDAIRKGALLEMRPILLACLAASVGLLPAAVSTGIGAQAQQPLARVVVGAMLTSLLAILFLIPALASYWLPPGTDSASVDEDSSE